MNSDTPSIGIDNDPDVREALLLEALRQRQGLVVVLADENRRLRQVNQLLLLREPSESVPS